jgi:hypothetical protein
MKGNQYMYNEYDPEYQAWMEGQADAMGATDAEADDAATDVAYDPMNDPDYAIAA